MRRVLPTAVCALALAGCASTGSNMIELRHPTSGLVARCSANPFAAMAGPWHFEVEAQRQRQCVQDFQRQGYERVPQ